MDNKISEQNKEIRKTVKTEIVHFIDVPELQHFATEKVNKNDNVYGVTWANLVREYLKTAYQDENAEAEVISWGVTYKVLKRREVTAFYDAEGNTLFDVENKRLEKEYAWLMDAGSQTDGDTGSQAPDVVETAAENKDLESMMTDQETSDLSEKNPEGKTSDESAGDGTTADAVSAKQKAKEKLEKEMKSDKDKSFAEPIIGYLLERCAEDEGLAQDVIQEHKIWKKCIDYIYEMVRRQTTGDRAAVRSDVVFEWAEDYYHKDDKAEEEKKARKEAERKAKQTKATAKKKVKAKEETAKTSVPEKKEDKPKEKPKPKKNSRDMDGQLDMFSMIEM